MGEDYWDKDKLLDRAVEAVDTSGLVGGMDVLEDAQSFVRLEQLRSQYIHAWKPYESSLTRLSLSSATMIDVLWDYSEMNACEEKASFRSQLLCVSLCMSLLCCFFNC